MILHCVFLRLKTAVTTEDKQSLFAAIVALKQVIPGILISNTGRMFRPRVCMAASSTGLP